MNNPRIVVAPTFVNDDGETFSVVRMFATCENVEQIVLAKPYVIPVLFLPGIMGTNLRNAKSKKSAWRPPNLDARGLADAILQLIAYAFTSASASAYKTNQESFASDEEALELWDALVESIRLRPGAV